MPDGTFRGPELTQAQIKDVLTPVVRHFKTDPEMQLSLLTRALIAAAKTLKIPRSIIVRELEKAWDDTKPLVRLIG